MAKKNKNYSTEYCILDPDGNLYQRGMYNEDNAIKKSMDLRGRLGDKFNYRPFTVHRVKDVL